MAKHFSVLFVRYLSKKTRENKFCQRKKKVISYICELI